MRQVSLHEDLERKQEGQGSSDRAFGIVFCVFFALVALSPLRAHHSVRWWALALSATFLLIGLIQPIWLAPNLPWHRKLISHLGTWLVRLFGGLQPLTDCTSGYRCIKADVFAKCDARALATWGYSFQSSLLCELIRKGARVIEVPIVFQERKRGESKLSFRDQIEFLLNLFRLRFKRPAS